MAQPSSLLSTPWQYYVPLLLASPVALLVVSKLWRRYQARNACLRHRHFIITGGSSGIGRALARAAVQRGANVTLAVHTLSADLTKGEAGEAVLARGIEEAEQVCGPVDYLVNCAGSAISLRFDETPLVEFQHMMEVNYLSAVHTTMAVLPGMKQRGSGSITFVSSIAGLMGLYGYTAYSPSKFALVGLAQSLRMEVKHRGIQVTVAFPPDTDTPGFAEEERTKPTETKLISAMAGLYSADVVATSLLQDILEGNTTSALGLDGHITVALCAGMMPPSSLLEAVVQALTMGILRVIGCLYVWHFYRLVARCAANREGSKKGS
ncbi:hypothetical protein HPB52_001860 [Rhipicephalus sanguineus]|uniref:3-dehydrosphinganine reductase n=1 Tax=Rhipicephalus sanguineus TaxID=34632 RepID=A0A9D4PMM0_RHISA|nr:hypothetical protein HPB52_001860 [Rhipicephalus sanguineus]